MNGPLFSARLGRLIAARDPHDLSAIEADEVLRAGNAALARLYDRIPQRFREREIAFALPAPRALNVTFTNAGARTVTPDTFLVTEIGCTAQIAGMPADTRITARNEVLDPFLLSALTQSCTVYGDAIALDPDAVQNLAGDPLLFGNTMGSHGHRLARIHNLARNTHHPDATGSAGTPTCYDVEARGEVTWLRFSPLPAHAFTARLRVVAPPPRIAHSDLADPAYRLPVPAGLAEDSFLPIAEAALADSPLFAFPDRVSAYRDRGMAALALDADRLPHDAATSRRTVKTPTGY